MKAIIIEEVRFVEILESLKYESERMVHSSNAPERLGVSKQVWSVAVHEVHSNFHYHLVRWMQGHGASCTR